MAEYSGKFIVVEGCECTGKSTLCSSIFRLLGEIGREAILTNEPGGTDLGQVVRKQLKDPAHKLSARVELALFMADRAHHIDEIILSSLILGRDVVCDRYKFSTYAYQCYAGEVPLEIAVLFNDFMTCGIEPDLLILLDGPPEELFSSRGRDEADRIEMKDIKYHCRVRDGFLDLFEKHPGQKVKIDAMLPAKEVKSQAWQAVTQLVYPR